MAGVVGDINPKTIESAKRQFVELYGSALVMNTYLKIALVLVSLVALGLLGLNFHTAPRFSVSTPIRFSSWTPDWRTRPSPRTIRVAC